MLRRHGNAASCGCWQVTPVKGDTRISVFILMDLFKNVGTKEEIEVDKQRASIRAAVTERTQLNEAKETGFWIQLSDKTNMSCGHKEQPLSAMDRTDSGGHNEISP